MIDLDNRRQNDRLADKQCLALAEGGHLVDQRPEGIWQQFLDIALVNRIRQAHRDEVVALREDRF